jgi:C-terminal processing protease CtpA/Prc
MKQLILVSLLGLSGMAVAQSADVQKSQADMKKTEAKTQADAARADADEAKTRAQLDEARKRLDEAARQVADLSMKLAHNEGGDMVFLRTDGPPRSVLGVQVDPESGKEGARVLRVSPGGAAEEAGLANGDVIVALDGKNLAGDANPARAVIEHMRDVKPDQKVKVKVLRAGKSKDFLVVARPAPEMFGERHINVHAQPIGAGFADGMPQLQFRTFWHDEFGGMELASITPKLGAYFGVTNGVLVVQAPDNAAYKLEDGDVIQSIDGRKPDDGSHALRILRSYKSGEKLNLLVLRQRKPLTLAVTMPDRPDFDGDFAMPPMPAMPAMPAAPAVPAMPAMPPAPATGIPGSTGTEE